MMLRCIFLIFFTTLSCYGINKEEKIANSSTLITNQDFVGNVTEVFDENETVNTVNPTTNVTTVAHTVSTMSTTKWTAVSSTPGTMIITELSTKQSTTDLCFSTKQATSGHISSPATVDQSKILQCDWIIIAPPNHKVRLKFTTFDLPMMSNNRCMDGFLLYGSFDEKNHRVVGNQVCGNEIPEDYVSLGNQCWLYYQATEQKASSRFELIFDSLFVDEQKGSNLSLLALLVFILPVVVIIFACYIMKKRKREQKRTEAEVFERFKKKHLRNRTLLLTKRNNVPDKKQSIQIRVMSPESLCIQNETLGLSHKKFLGHQMRITQITERNILMLIYQQLNNLENMPWSQDNSVFVEVSRPSDENNPDNRKKYFDADISAIKQSGEYAMVPGQFCVRRVIMPSGFSTDGSVFLTCFFLIPPVATVVKETPDELKSSPHGSSFSYGDNFLSIPNKFSHGQPLPSYMSFRQPCSIGSIEHHMEPLRCTHQQQTAVAMETSESMDSMTDTSSYKDPPPYQSHSEDQHSEYSHSINSHLPKMISDTSVFTNEHPMRLDRHKKKRRNYRSTSMVNSENRKRSKYYSMTWNDRQPPSYHSARSNFRSKPDNYSYRPGTGHTKFLSSTSVTNGNRFMPQTNLQRGKWEDINCLNESDYRISSSNCCSVQNLFEMQEMCKTMPVLHMSSYSSIFQEHNTMSFSHPILHVRPPGQENSSTSNNENMSLINEEDTSGTFKVYDNPAFEVDVSPLHQNKTSQFCSVDGNQSYVDINNNTQINNSTKEKSVVMNEFCPGENSVIILSQGETMV